MSTFKVIMLNAPITIFILGILIFLAFPIRIENQEKKRKLNVSRVLTAVFPGLGYIYLGNWIRGIVLAIVWVWAVVITIKNGMEYALNPSIGPDFISTLCMLIVIWLLGFIGLSGWRKSKQKKIENEESL